jgi:hypothetical protein
MQVLIYEIGLAVNYWLYMFPRKIPFSLHFWNNRQNALFIIVLPAPYPVSAVAFPYKYRERSADLTITSFYGQGQEETEIYYLSRVLLHLNGP